MGSTSFATAALLLLGATTAASTAPSLRGMSPPSVPADEPLVTLPLEAAALRTNVTARELQSLPAGNVLDIGACHCSRRYPPAALAFWRTNLAVSGAAMRAFPTHLISIPSLPTRPRRCRHAGVATLSKTADAIVLSWLVTDSTLPLTVRLNDRRSGTVFAFSGNYYVVRIGATSGVASFVDADGAASFQCTGGTGTPLVQSTPYLCRTCVLSARAAGPCVRLLCPPCCFFAPVAKSPSVVLREPHPTHLHHRPAAT